CHACGATHTPLWRCRLNDELNCNACGLYCKFVSGQGGNNNGEVAQGAGHATMHGGHTGTNGSVQCYNCHTTATPLWRKDNEGKTICNA
ncbi:hypothetical protein EDC04DRAFT_2567615, partial [Pisolithus marmoratus]